MKLLIAEKPDLAKSIGEGLDGKYTAGNGYFEKGENIITWAFGHIMELYMPEDYDEKYKSWNLSLLPIAIDKFEYKPISDKKKQLKIICDLIKDSRVSSIVNCGDADEEGQILIDEIINYSKTKKPVERVLLQDLTEKGVRAAFKNIKSNDEFKNLSECGFARSQADWLVGINLTRAYTSQAQSHGFQGVLSVGRVQTPILGLIVKRDLENSSHKSSFYYTLQGSFDTQNKTILANLKIDDKITDEAIAISIKNNCIGKNATISVKSENKLENPPLPYNLLILQAECSKKFGLKPDKTLEITQALREKHKLISYNRSDCQYLPENMHELCPEILSSIKSTLKDDEYSKIIDNANTSIKSLAFNDKNITAHYAIIPTSKTADKTALSKLELSIYEMIAKRFIAQFYPAREYLHTSVEISIRDNIFTTTSNKTLKDGFKVVFGANNDEETDKETTEDDNLNTNIDLSLLKGDEPTKCSDIKIDKKSTKPKPLYTMATLLKDLTGVSKYVVDEKIKKLLQEKDKDKKGENGGIGTPATRSAHIKTLFDRGYIEEKGKNIISTKKGQDLINLAPKSLTNPDMTALWFENQKEILAGQLTRSEFLSNVTKSVVDEIENIKNNTELTKMGQAHSSAYPCKSCGNGFLKRYESKKKKGAYWWGCSNWQNGCKQTYFDKDGKPDGYDENIAKTGTKQEQQTNGIPCPVCKKGILERKKNQKGTFWWGCSEWKNGCKAMYYDNNGKPKIDKDF